MAKPEVARYALIQRCGFLPRLSEKAVRDPLIFRIGKQAGLSKRSRLPCCTRIVA